MKKLSLLAIAFILRLAPLVSMAEDNVFLPPDGGDLANADNWSLGVVPGVGVIEGDGTKEFVLGADVSNMVLRGMGDELDWKIDLNEKTWNSGGNASLLLNAPSHQSYAIKNGTMQNVIFGRENFFNYDPGDSVSAHVSVENVDWDSGWNLEVSGENKGLIDDGSSVRRVRMVGESAVLEVKGGSTLGNASNPEEEVLRLEGTTLAKLVVDEGSQLLGGFYLINSLHNNSIPVQPSELIIRGGSKTFAPTGIQISRDSTTVIEGQGTVAEFQTFYTFSESIPQTLSEGLGTFTIRGGALVSIVGPPNVLDFSATVPVSFILGSVTVQGEGSGFASTGDGGDVFSLHVTDGATFTSENLVKVIGEVVVSDAEVTANLIGKFSPPIPAVFGISTDVEVTRGVVNGSVHGFRELRLDDSAVIGDVAVLKVIGHGLIDGDLENARGSNVPLQFDLEGLLKVTGVVDSDLVMAFDINGRPGANNGQLQIGTLILDSSQAVWYAGPGQHEAFEFDVRFATDFKGRIGDRYDLLVFENSEPILTTADLDFIMSLTSATREQILNLSFLNAPGGYAFNVFIEEGAIGFTVSAVPEASTIVMVGVGMSLMVLARFRTRRRAIA